VVLISLGVALDRSAVPATAVYSDAGIAVPVVVIAAVGVGVTVFVAAAVVFAMVVSSATVVDAAKVALFAMVVVVAEAVVVAIVVLTSACPPHVLATTIASRLQMPAVIPLASALPRCKAPGEKSPPTTVYQAVAGGTAVVPRLAYDR